MLRYQRETDEKAAKQLQAEVRRIREVESGRIRQEERSKARAEVVQLRPSKLQGVQMSLASPVGRSWSTIWGQSHALHSVLAQSLV